MFELFRAGEQISREDFRRRLNAIPEVTLGSIQAGPGIRILPTGTGGMSISATATGSNQRGMGSGDGAFLVYYVSALNVDGDTIDCVTYDPVAEEYSETITSVKKPPMLQKSTYNGLSITYTDGREIAYDVTDLDAAYQRRATWTEDEEEITEVQAITPAYGIYEKLMVVPYDGALYDATPGRSWALATVQPPPPEA
jgi:hypothetical protein